MSEKDIVQRLTEKKGNVVAISQFLSPGDRHLRVACIEIGDGQYATWMVNTDTMMDFEDAGCSLGHYFTLDSHATNRREAMIDFTNRLRSDLRS